LECFVSVEYIGSDKTTSLSAVYIDTVTLDDLDSNSPSEVSPGYVTGENLQPPSATGYMLLTVGLQRGSAANGDTGSVLLSEVKVDIGSRTISLPDLTHPEYGSGEIRQVGGGVIIRPGTAMGGVGFDPNIQVYDGGASGISAGYAGISAQTIYLIGNVDLSSSPAHSLLLPRGTTGGGWVDPTADGSIAWKSDDNVAKVGTGSGTVTLLDTTAAAGAYAPIGADYLVGTANGSLTGEIVVGTTPGGELGGTWTSPTVDATHSGSAHVLLTANTPAAVSTSGAVGTGTASAKDDHVHAHEAAHTAHDTIWDAKGDIVAATGADAAAKVAVGTNTHVLQADSTQSSGVKWDQVATAGIADAAVNAAKISNRSALSVFGRSANSGGVGADIAASAASDAVLRESGSTIGFGTVATAGIADAAVTLAKMANLAQDQFVGRTTASTGVPQTATITSAARTVLDDTTVGAMRTTLGGGTDLSLVGHGAADHADLTRVKWLTAQDARLGATGVGSATILNTGLDQFVVVPMANAANTDCFWLMGCPDDYVTGTNFSIRVMWSPGASDATPHTVQFNVTARYLVNSSAVATAGTGTPFTGGSAARTAGTEVLESAVDTGVSGGNVNGYLRIDLQRLGSDGSDTYTGTVNVIAVQVSYTANQ
jgi:hypothetical protein